MNRKAFVYLRSFNVLFAKHLYKKAGKTIIESTTIKDLIDQDMQRYSPKIIRGGNYFRLSYLLLNNKVFRTQFYFRIEQDQELGSSIAKALSKVFLPPLDNVQIGIMVNAVKVFTLRLCISAYYIHFKRVKVKIFTAFTIIRRVLLMVVFLLSIHLVVLFPFIVPENF